MNKNKGTAEGRQEEKEFVREINKKENNLIWKKLNLERENHYGIHLSEGQYSKITGKKVLPKSDVIIGYGKIEKEFLKKNNYYLNLKDFKTFNLNYVLGSGISVKRKDSKNYQIHKFTPDAFYRVFNNYQLGAGACIYCLREEELIKNDNVLRGWKTSWENFIEYFEKDFKNVHLLRNCNEDLNNAKILAEKIKNFSVNKIVKIINNNEYISNIIFLGKDNFEDPFWANWLYDNGSLKNNGIIPFNVTTGSGRSRGDFTLVIKPKK